MRGQVLFLFVDISNLEMAGLQHKLSICSFNCRSVKSSLHEINKFAVNMIFF